MPTLLDFWTWSSAGAVTTTTTAGEGAVSLRHPSNVLIDSILRRVRDTQGSANSRDLVLDLLSRCQQLLNLGIRAVIDQTVVTLEPYRTLYDLSVLVPQAGRVVGVQYLDVELDVLNWRHLKHVDRAWFRSVGPAPSAWAGIGRDLLAIIPAVEIATPVTILSAKLTDVLDEYADPIEIPEAYEPLLCDMVEGLLLLKQRTFAPLTSTAARVVARFNAFAKQARDGQ